MFTIPDAKQNICATIPYFLSYMSDCGNLRYIVRCLIEVIKACYIEILWYPQTVIGSCLTHTDCDIITGTYNSLWHISVRKLVQILKSMYSALICITFIVKILFLIGNPMTAHIIFQASCTHLILIIIGWSHNEPESSTSMFLMKMCYHFLYGCIIINTNIVEIFYFLGNGNNRLPGLLCSFYDTFAHIRISYIIGIQYDSIEI